MKRHPTDLLSLLSGLLFAGLGGLFALDRLDRIDLDARWIPAVVLLGLGLAMLLGAFARPETTDAVPVEPAMPTAPAATEGTDESPVAGEPATVEHDVVG
jgi:hypothetical protein